ncbi:MAG TPA: nodulation protein NfeD [candidate division Zixibacteria bacterium]|nr:nodulation protein NfeD [candidate division Zixibacteria bacterium]
MDAYRRRLTFFSRTHRLTIWLALTALGALGLFTALTARADEDSAVVDTIEIAAAGARSLVYTLNIDGAIGAVTAKRIVEAIEQAEDDRAEALVIILDTPGGFTSATWTIDKAILNSHVPVIVYIAPAGARAGSAGVFITYAAHIAAMAPGTNIGAAHPVGGGGEDIDSVMNEKVTNDAVASIRAMADKRGRNAEWAERAVRESVSITDREADSLNVINVRAESLQELLAALNGRQVETPAGTETLELADVREVELEESFIESVLRIITSPDIAFILFSIGGLGIMLELYNPGAILPGVVGAISLILAFYAFQTLPINTAGLLLILLALILFIAESQITSYGLLTVGGIVSLALGGLMLIDTYDPALQVSVSVIWSVALGVGLVMALVVFLIAKSYRRQVSTGAEGMVGQIGIVRKALAPEGLALVAGELWKARSLDKDAIEPGAEVVVDHVENIYLVVKKLPPEGSGSYEQA